VIRKGSYLYYLLAIVIFILLKFSYTLSNNDDLFFLLNPTNKIIGLITGSNATYLPEQGFLHHQLNIIIDKSCSGFNFWMISYMMLTFLGLKYITSDFQKILLIPIALLVAYMLTIITSSSRIIVSIIIQNHTSNFLFLSQSTIHESIGVITNLSFLIITYFLFNNFLSKMNPYEKLT